MALSVLLVVINSFNSSVKNFETFKIRDGISNPDDAVVVVNILENIPTAFSNTDCTYMNMKK
jgi:hypothetical protein